MASRDAILRFLCQAQRILQLAPLLNHTDEAAVAFPAGAAGAGAEHSPDSCILHLVASVVLPAICPAASRRQPPPPFARLLAALMAAGVHVGGAGDASVLARLICLSLAQARPRHLTFRAKCTHSFI